MSNWNEELRKTFEKKTEKATTKAATMATAKEKVIAWMESTALPALEEFALELQSQGRETTYGANGMSSTITIKHKD